MPDIKESLKAVERADITVTLPSMPKAKLPKTKLGGLVDQLKDLQTARLALNKVVEAMKAEEQRVTDHIIEIVDANDEGGCVGQRFKGVVVREQVPVVEDWDALYTHIKKKGEFDLLNKALNRGAVKERYEANKTVPGVGSFQAKKLSITRVK